MAKKNQIADHGIFVPTGAHRRHIGGFSLIELAVVVVVITLLLGSIMVPLSSQIEKRRYSNTQQQLEHVSEALIGFALAKRHLPCPTNSATDGLEDRTGNECDIRAGFLPWVSLGVTPTDAWGNLLRYSVDPDFARSDQDDLFALEDTGDIQIKTRDGAGAEANLSNVEIPAIVLSHGKNGFGATSGSNIVQVTPGGWAGDEQVNATGSTVIYARDDSGNTAATGGEYDDVVVWLSLNQLFARMVSAGRLP